MIQKKICRTFEDVQFYPGQIIFEQGKNPEYIYFLKSGTCGIFKEIEGAPRKIYEVSGNEWLGDEFILTDKIGNRQYNIEAGEY